MDRFALCIWNKMCEMSGKDVARVFTNYYGNKLMDEGFYRYLVEEGYMDDELGLDEEDEESE